MIDVTIIPVLEDNYAYLLRSQDRLTAVVDPGEAGPIIDYLEANALTLDYILNTHHHGDHTAGNAALKKKYGSTVLGPEKERGRIPVLDRGLSEGEVFSFGQEEMKIMETPGHTLGAICFYFPDSLCLFTGDTLFLMGCGRLFEGTPAQMYQSLKKIAALPDDVLIYCGHEYTLEATDFCLSIEPDNE
ncbi:MAG: hydroxyacylglutathione hydrolase, partial [Alphaproteobacteria bacterium]|nr:hydroxyacylglutathione hydrolase [Alphaproteobacteria bacterium]